MALIKCTECGHEVSDKASICPNCGCPIESLGAAQEEVIYEEPKKKKGWIWALIVALLCLVLGGGYYAYTKFFIGVSEKDAIVELTPEFIKAIEKYDQLGIFSEGYAAVRKGEKWGYINAKGEEVIPVNIDAHCVGRFSEGLAFVAHGTEFSVIDKKGNVVFKKNGFNWDSEYSESHEMPYFIGGKIYLPTLDFKHDVYDKQGNKLGTISWEEKDSIQKISVKSSNAVFVEETRVVGEVEDYVCRKKYGVIDSIGKVLISAKYDEMVYDRDKDNTDRPFSSNGVILVVLEELEEGHYTDGSKYDPSIRHYGYVDLKGNDTFSEGLKARCLKAEKMAIQKKLDEEQKEFEENYNASTTNNNIDMTIHFTYGEHKNESGFMRLHKHDEGSWPPIETAYSQLGNAYICSTNIEIDEGKTYMFLGYEVEDGKSKVVGLYYSKSNERIAAHSLSNNDGQAVILMPGKYYFTVVARIPNMYDEGDATCKVNLHFVEQSY